MKKKNVVDDTILTLVLILEKTDKFSHQQLQ